MEYIISIVLVMFIIGCILYIKFGKFYITKMNSKEEEARKLYPFYNLIDTQISNAIVAEAVQQSRKELNTVVDYLNITTKSKTRLYDYINKQCKIRLQTFINKN